MLDYYPKLLTLTPRSGFSRACSGAGLHVQVLHHPPLHAPRHERGSPPHQDHFYIRHTPDFRTMWIPLMDIDRTVGGLAVAEDSHKRGLQEHTELDVYSYVLKGRRQKGVAQENISRAGADYLLQPGRYPGVPQPNDSLGATQQV